MYSKILLPIDLEHDNSWKKALNTAVELCKNSGASLHMVAVVPDFGMSIVEHYFPEGYEQEMADKAMERLKDFAAKNVPDDVEVQHIVGEGKVYDVVLKIAAEIEADLIVVSAHRPEMAGFLLGRNSARVVRHAECSVLVVRD